MQIDFCGWPQVEWLATIDYICMVIRFLFHSSSDDSSVVAWYWVQALD